MTTAIDLVDGAYTALGYKDARQALDGADLAYGFDRLNDMIDSWNTQSLFIFNTVDVIANASGLPITIGPGQAINTPRPVRLPPGSFARVLGSDYPIKWIDADEYNSIVIKDVVSNIPIYAHYDAGTPTGTVSFWPYQTTTTEYHILIEVQLTEFATPSTDVSLPQGYRRALILSLAEELSPGLKEPTAMLMRNAANARRAIRQANAKVPMLNYADIVTTTLSRFISGI